MVGFIHWKICACVSSGAPQHGQVPSSPNSPFCLPVCIQSYMYFDISAFIRCLMFRLAVTSRVGYCERQVTRIFLKNLATAHTKSDCRRTNQNPKEACGSGCKLKYSPEEISNHRIQIVSLQKRHTLRSLSFHSGISLSTLLRYISLSLIHI